MQTHHLIGVVSAKHEANGGEPVVQNSKQQSFETSNGDYTTINAEKIQLMEQSTRERMRHSLEGAVFE